MCISECALRGNEKNAERGNEKNVVIDLSKWGCVLVGRNGSGKTNILKAIQWAAESATSTKPIEYISCHPTKISLVLTTQKMIVTVANRQSVCYFCI
ncbi:hypothetical protein PN36_20595 [Candidatus Thiomargarita nelsonii]|uniref:ATPase AAA-type core domain-containing protein n=1 Tax=Candidatus Thiomargarita nelsonii TaxID=1003181 RepID=A0A4E0QMR6_9GAMM|nr:hypothetical protein PN36_20595 [Candidatus Thiomargarita nelsonii]